MTKPWYADGLRFACTQCGNCCTGEPGFVWVNDAEIAAIAEVRGWLASNEAVRAGDRAWKARDLLDKVERELQR